MAIKRGEDRWVVLGTRAYDESGYTGILTFVVGVFETRDAAERRARSAAEENHNFCAYGVQRASSWEERR